MGKGHWWEKKDTLRDEKEGGGKDKEVLWGKDDVLRHCTKCLVIPTGNIK